MRKKIKSWQSMLVFLVCHVLWSSGWAGTYYVDKDSIGGPSSDSNQGTITEPWETLGKANTTLTAGDTVYIRAGAYTNDNIQPANSGTSDTNRISYCSYGDEVVTLQGLVYGIRLNSKSYITITGIRLYNCERNLYLSDSDNNDIGSCEFDTPAGPATWAGSRLYNGSTSNRIHNCIFSRYGKEDFYGGGYQDYGCNLDIGNDGSVDHSDHNLVVSNTFFYGGHHILGVYSCSNVVRENTFHNEEWYTSHRTNIGGLSGNRNVILNTSDAEGNVRNVIEDNHIVFSGVPPDQDSSSGMGVRTKHNIIRRNVFYCNDSAGLALTANSGNNNGASGNHIYHNVFYRNGYPLLDTWHVRKTGMLIARWVDDPGYNQITNVAVKNNIFHENQMYAIYYYYVNKSDQAVQNNWEEAGDPGFVDTAGPADPFDFTVFDFHLLPMSPCIDNGGFLTQAVNGGTNGTVLEVEDAGYFTDGMGVIPGDVIQPAGQTHRARIVGVDYNANTLTLDSPLSWAVGTGISLPYFGAKPDQGVHEYSVAGMADVDRDSMPDIWEEENLPGGDGEPDVDEDRDGLSNLEEYIAGTSATNGLSAFSLEINCASGRAVVSVPPIPAEGAGYAGRRRFYRLKERESLQIGGWVGVADYTNVPASAHSIEYTNTDLSLPRFYGASVRLE